MDKKNVDGTNNKEKEKIEEKSYYEYDFEDMGYFEEMKLWGE